MKKIIWAIIVLFTNLTCYAQVFNQEDKKNVIVLNRELSDEIKKYIEYVKGFSAEHKMQCYLVTLKVLQSKDRNTYKLGIVSREGEINIFNSSSISIYNLMPILIHMGFEKHKSPDTNLIKFVKTNYWKGRTEEEEKAIIQQRYAIRDKEFHRNLPDSVSLWDKQGKIVKVSSKTLTLTHYLSPEDYPLQPKTWTLIFIGQNLKSQTEDLLLE